MTTALERRKFEESVWNNILEITKPLPFGDKAKIEFLIFMMKMYLHPREVDEAWYIQNGLKKPKK